MWEQLYLTCANLLQEIKRKYEQALHILPAHDVLLPNFPLQSLIGACWRPDYQVCHVIVLATKRYQKQKHGIMAMSLGCYAFGAGQAGRWEPCCRWQHQALFNYQSSARPIRSASVPGQGAAFDDHNKDGAISSNMSTTIRVAMFRHSHNDKVY